MKEGAAIVKEGTAYFFSATGLLMAAVHSILRADFSNFT
jgi:hypothetical protein